MGEASNTRGVEDKGTQNFNLNRAYTKERFCNIYWLRLKSRQLYIDWISRLIKSKGNRFPIRPAVTDNFILALADKR
jgi:hypothetical protein